ncbi:hypothetical protein [Rhodococcus jostii]|uniref:hypothetical protein n=1 Tax=Rhodococcus jostii TaxID=132919 RepID=UPI0036499B5C
MRFQSLEETVFWLSQPGIRDTVAEAEADIATGNTSGEVAILAEFGVVSRGHKKR